MEYENHCRTFSNHRLQFINSILLLEDILFAGDENNVLSINLDSNKAEFIYILNFRARKNENTLAIYIKNNFNVYQSKNNKKIMSL